MKNLEIRDCMQRIEDYVHRKYQQALALPEDCIPMMSKRLEKIMDRLEDGATVRQIKKAAEALTPEETQSLAKLLMLFVADNTGNLLETYKYEGIDDGEHFEDHLDQMLSLARSLDHRYQVKGTNNVRAA